MTHMARLTDLTTLHIVSYLAGTPVFTSLHKPTITLTITPFMCLVTVFIQHKCPYVPNAGSDKVKNSSVN